MKNANLKVLGILGYQPVLLEPRKTKKLRGGVEFYLSEADEFEPIEFETAIENAIIRVKFGPDKYSSCTYAIAHITELMRQAIDKGATGQACFLELKKAFESLKHSILLRKIYNLGFRGQIFELLES